MPRHHASRSRGDLLDEYGRIPRRFWLMMSASQELNGTMLYEGVSARPTIIPACGGWIILLSMAHALLGFAYLPSAARCRLRCLTSHTTHGGAVSPKSSFVVVSSPNCRHRLLRPHHNRPSHRTANQPNQLPPPHARSTFRNAVVPAQARPQEGGRAHLCLLRPVASIWPDHCDFRPIPVNGHSQDRAGTSQRCQKRT